MKTRSTKKILKSAAIVSGLLILVLVVHIFLVTRPKPIDPHAVAMARIDIKTDIDQAAADRITGWLYTQNGIDHVLVNPETNIVIFTFFPAKAKADDIVTAFTSFFHLPARRYVPSAAELKGGCPVAATSISYKMYNFIKHIF